MQIYIEQEIKLLEQSFECLLEEEYITIRLSKNDWRQYPGIKDRAEELLHSALVLPILVNAISVVDDYSEFLWASRLKAALAGKQIDQEDPLMAAQELLDSPIRRTFESVNVVLDREGE